MSSFRELADNIGRLKQIPSRIATPVAERITELLKSEFDSESDPYGTRWAPLAQSTIDRKGSSKILTDSGVSASQTVATPLPGAGIQLTTTEIMGFHQFGTRHHVARPVLPARSELPKTWQNVIKEELDKAFK